MDSTAGSSDIGEIAQQNSADEIPTEVTPMQPMQTMEPSYETETRTETTEPEIEPPPKKRSDKKASRAQQNSKKGSRKDF